MAKTEFPCKYCGGVSDSECVDKKTGEVYYICVSCERKRWYPEPEKIPGWRLKLRGRTLIWSFERV